MRNYFLHNGIEQLGPFTIEELKIKGINSKTSIWYEGLENWTTADKIDELKSIIQQLPPDFKKNVDTKFVPKKSNFWKLNKFQVFVLFIFILLIIGWIVNNIQRANNYDLIEYGDSTAAMPVETYEQKILTVEEIEMSDPLKFLSADARYETNFWGNKIKIHGKINNSATVVSYKDVVVRITYYTKTKTELGTHEHTLYEIFTPTSSKNFELKIDNFKDVDSISVEVIKAEIYQN